MRHETNMRLPNFNVSSGSMLHSRNTTLFFELHVLDSSDDPNSLLIVFLVGNIHLWEGFHVVGPGGAPIAGMHTNLLSTWQIPDCLMKFSRNIKI
jgi:hypothetical protein